LNLVKFVLFLYPIICYSEAISNVSYCYRQWILDETFSVTGCEGCTYSKTRRGVEVNSKDHAPADINPGKYPGNHWIWGSVDLRGTFKGSNFVSFFRNSDLDPPACRKITIPNEIQRMDCCLENCNVRTAYVGSTGLGTVTIANWI